MRRIDDRWTERTLEWIPRDVKRPRGRPPTGQGDVFATRMDQLRAQLIHRCSGSRTSSTSPTKLENILYDNGRKERKRVEEMLGSARLVKTGHPSSQVSK
ncbi:hypothetical protein RB195_019307 [Necator americanus]|uniref:Uncharacterized protein n=1 Tax=Necator americanus TaxID=51031 RepID=A0ABR1CDL9_NECAM